MPTAGGGTGPFYAGSIILKKMGTAFFTGAGSPVNGAAGTGVGKVGIGGVYLDRTNGVSWINVGTKALPTWSPQGPVILTVTSANILAMNATPVNLVAAPPAGFSIIGVNVVMVMTRTATAYANGGVVSLVYTGGAVSPHSGSMPAAVVTGGAGVAINGMGGVSAANGIVVPTAVGVDITNATAAFITGTGTLKVLFDYRVMRQA